VIFGHVIKEAELYMRDLCNSFPFTFHLWWTRKKSDLDAFVKSSNSKRANFVIMKPTYHTLNDCEIQRNAKVGLSNN